jgi:hypothetical protein
MRTLRFRYIMARHLSALAVITLSGPLAGQSADPPDHPIPLPQMHERAGTPAPYADPALTVELMSQRTALDSADVDAYIVLAREAAALGLLGETEQLRKEWLVRSEEAARKAAELDADRVDTSYWLAATLGLRADVEGGQTKISLARESHAWAVRTLQMDSLHAGTNHLLGRLHAGARRLSWINRMIARTLGLGEILREASWESAERHIRIAAEREPDQLVHLYDLAKLLIDREVAVEEGVALLEALASREPRHALDDHWITSARTALVEIESGGD